MLAGSSGFCLPSGIRQWAVDDVAHSLSLFLLASWLLSGTAFHSPALDLSNNISTARTASSSSSSPTTSLSTKQFTVVHHQHYRKTSNQQMQMQQWKKKKGGLHSTDFFFPSISLRAPFECLCLFFYTLHSTRRKWSSLGREEQGQEERGLKKGRHTYTDIFAHMACTCLVDRFVQPQKTSQLCVCQCPREKEREQNM